MSAVTDVDVLIIGAGPAGLTAATYLTRFHRRIAVVDAGQSRARWIPASHNCPGFPFGVAGTALLDKLRLQAERFGAPITRGRIATLARNDGGFLAADDAGQQWQATYVLLATGIVDRMPPLVGGMPALETAIADNQVRLCAVCDGYEASDERIAVYGPVAEAVKHAEFLRTFSRSVTVLPSTPEEAPAATVECARAARIPLLPMPTTLEHRDSVLRTTFADGSTRDFDTLYPVLGADAQSSLALALGALGDDCDELIVDDEMQTQVDGLYAIGDIVSALNQISVAMGHAAIAASKIHNRLPSNWREDEDTQPDSATSVTVPTHVDAGSNADLAAP